jgi:AcrR family transcriptional regulator
MARIFNSHAQRARKRAVPAADGPRKRPSQARSKGMVESLMRATARILIRDGYDALTTNRVAEEAGASVGSLYQYFSSKEALVGALLEQHAERIIQRMREELPRLMLLPVAQAVPHFVELMIEAHRIEPELHRVFAEQLPRVGRFAKVEAFLAEGMAMAEVYLRARAAEIRPQNIALSAFMLVHAIEALTHAAVQSRPELLSTPEFVTELSGMILSHLQPKLALNARPRRGALPAALRS